MEDVVMNALDAAADCYRIGTVITATVSFIVSTQTVSTAQ
jgi:hypothetical protein